VVPTHPMRHPRIRIMVGIPRLVGLPVGSREDLTAATPAVMVSINTAATAAVMVIIIMGMVPMVTMVPMVPMVPMIGAPVDGPSSIMTGAKGMGTQGMGLTDMEGIISHMGEKRVDEAHGHHRREIIVEANTSIRGGGRRRGAWLYGCNKCDIKCFHIKSTSLHFLSFFIKKGMCGRIFQRETGELHHHGPT